MKKVIIGVVAIAIIALVIVGIVMISGKNNENGGTSTENAKMQTVEEMQETLNSIYTKLGEQLPSIETREIDVTDELFEFLIKHLHRLTDSCPIAVIEDGIVTWFKRLHSLNKQLSIVVNVDGKFISVNRMHSQNAD